MGSVLGTNNESHLRNTLYNWPPFPTTSQNVIKVQTLIAEIKRKTNEHLEHNLIKKLPIISIISNFYFFEY